VTLLGQGVGLGDPQRALPTPAMLGFCDSAALGPRTSPEGGWSHGRCAQDILTPVAARTEAGFGCSGHAALITQTPG